jgi:predicted dinucleotide-binding enzyme
MKIGILGSGLMGGKLGTLFARAGHEVVFSYAKTKGKLERLAKEAGANAKAGTPGEAVEKAEALLLAVHWSRIPDVLKQTGNLAGKVLISCSLPMDENISRLILGLNTSGAEELVKLAPKTKVVSAFNTIPSEVLFGVYGAKAKTQKPSLVYCGDDAGAKKIAGKLIADAGFEPVDLGGLKNARYTEPFALLVAEIAYGGKKGPEMAYRFDWFK